MAMSGAGEKVSGGQPHIPASLPEPKRERLPLGPLQNVHVFWLAGMSCDGCSVAVTGATNPGIEGLLQGIVPAMPKVILHHPVLSVAAGKEFVQPFKDAAAGTTACRTRCRPRPGCTGSPLARRRRSRSVRAPRGAASPRRRAIPPAR